MLGIGPSEGTVRFEGFELDVRSAELRSPDGKTLRLSEQPLRILVALVERPGELVLREDLRKRLWPNDTIVEFEHSINAAVNRLRQVLGESADNPKFIETLARRGYRWKTSVEWNEPPAASGPVPERAPHGNLVGKKVCHYRVLEILGGGGMGVVYKAEDIKLGRRVALKFLPEELSGDPAAMQRFEREARAASALNHPNICTIYGVDEYEDQPFIVMELLDGRTLRDRIADHTISHSALPMQSLVDIAIQIARGLGAAHERGVIHRDIKPANIFLTNNGEAKILDFGLAKLHDGDALETQFQVAAETQPSRAWNPLLTLTRTGVTVGTAAYMSPEQVRGEKLDARSDIFSFGLVIYEMATGQRAFPGDTAPILHHAIVNETPAPVRNLNPGVSGKLEGIIRKAIEKDRGARFQSAKQISVELENLQRHLAPKHLARAWAAGFGVAMVLVLGFLLFLLNRPPKTIAVAPEIKLRQLTTNASENPVIGGTISPDGKYLAYSDTRGMRLKLLDTGETRSIPEPPELKHQSVRWGITAWFPDSTRFLANAYPATEEWNEWSSDTASIWSISVLAEAPTKLRDHAMGCAVSSDGKTISFATNKEKRGEREVWLMGPNGDQARKYLEMKEGTGTDCWGWSPDGKYNGWVLNDESGTRLLSQRIAGGPVVTLFGPDDLKGVNDIVWLHDGRVIYDLAEPDRGGSNYWIGRIDPDTGKRLEQPRRLTNWPGFSVASGSVSNDDKKLTFAASSGFITTDVTDVNADGTGLSHVRRFSQEGSHEYTVAWAADSKSVIVGRSGPSEVAKLFKQPLNSDAPEFPLGTIGGAGVAWAAMTPDGKWLIALLWPPGQPFSGEPFTKPFPLVRFPASGGAPQTITEVSTLVFLSCPKVASKSCVMVEQSDDKKRMIVSALDAVKGRGTELARIELERFVDLLVDNLVCVISPDGTLLALTRSPLSPVEIRSLNGQLIRKVPFHPSSKVLWINWAADQKGLFLTTRAPGGTELLHIDLRGNATSLRKCLGVNACLANPSPDGRHLAILDHKQATNIWMMENF